MQDSSNFFSRFCATVCPIDGHLFPQWPSRAAKNKEQTMLEELIPIVAIRRVFRRHRAHLLSALPGPARHPGNPAHRPGQRPGVEPRADRLPGGQHRQPPGRSAPRHHLTGHRRRRLRLRRALVGEEEAVGPLMRSGDVSAADRGGLHRAVGGSSAGNRPPSARAAESRQRDADGVECIRSRPMRRPTEPRRGWMIPTDETF